MLAQLTEELDAADEAQHELEELRFELAAIDEQLRDVTAGAPRRQFARLVLELQQVQAEADLANEQIGLATADAALVAAGPEVRRLVGPWEATVARAGEQRRRFGDRVRLDPDGLAQGLTIPDRVAVELPGLMAALQGAETAPEASSRPSSPRLRPGRRQRKPSHPAVAVLARADQDVLWRAAHAAQAAEQRVSDASLALGGLEAGGMTPAIVDELDDAQTELEEAEASFARVRGLTHMAGIVAAVLSVGCLIVLIGGMGPTVGGLPAFPARRRHGDRATAGSVGLAQTAPRRRMANARVRVDAALQQAGVPTYLAFHMRRIDPTLDKTAGQSLETALVDERRASARWTALAGDTTPDDALALETVKCGRTLRPCVQLDGDGSDEIRRRLVDVAELWRAGAGPGRGALAACASIRCHRSHQRRRGGRPPGRAGHRRRLQAALEEAERAEAASVIALTAVLDPLGFVGPAPWNSAVRSFRDRLRRGRAPPAGPGPCPSPRRRAGRPGAAGGRGPAAGPARLGQ